MIIIFYTTPTATANDSGERSLNAKITLHLKQSTTMSRIKTNTTDKVVFQDQTNRFCLNHIYIDTTVLS